MAPIKNRFNGTACFHSGDRVYARYFGDRELIVKTLADTGKKFPHYICSLDGEHYLISQLHLSSKKLVSEVGDGNRRQLALPV